MKIIHQTKFPKLYAKLKTLDANLACVEETECIYPDDLLFTDHIPTTGFYNIHAHVILVASTHSPKMEFKAAMAGAKGFILMEMPAHILKQVVKTIISGNVWMTRATTAQIFDEYAKLVASNKTNEQGSLSS
ncbi:MAG: hypothetical protein Q9M31_03000 [Mariprofundus sp.]|nr:hypothetical protein [Mariprofundus sp.]